MLDVGHYKSPKAPPARASATTRIDLTGRRFGRLVVTTYVGDRKWSCVCDCGANHDARSSHLREGRIRSCGCLARELTGATIQNSRDVRYAGIPWMEGDEAALLQSAPCGL